MWSVLPHLSVLLTLSSGERRKREREGRERVYLPSCSGLFCFFLLLWIAFLCFLSFSFSFSPPPPPLPLSLVFFREGKRLLSSRLELLLSAYLAIILFSSSSHHHHHQSSWVSWKRLCKSYIPPYLPSLALLRLYDFCKRKKK